MLKEAKEFIAREMSVFNPSKELINYIQETINGRNSHIPVYGKVVDAIFDYYGKNKEGHELARFRIPWGHHEKMEKSYHITRKNNGSYHIVDEGFFPYRGD